MWQEIKDGITSGFQSAWRLGRYLLTTPKIIIPAVIFSAILAAYAVHRGW